MASKKRINQSDLIENVMVKSFSEFLLNSGTVEILSPLTSIVAVDDEKKESVQVSQSSLDMSPDIATNISIDEANLEAIDSSISKNLALYKSNILNSSFPNNEKLMRVEVFFSTHSSVKIIHESLNKNGIKISLPIIYDYIIQEHVKGMGSLYKKMQRENRK